MPNVRGLHSLKTFRIAVKAAREAFCAHDTWLAACFQGSKSVKARGLNPVKTSRTNNKLSLRFCLQGAASADGENGVPGTFFREAL